MCVGMRYRNRWACLHSSLYKTKRYFTSSGLHGTRPSRDPFQPNLTSLTNMRNRDEYFIKFGNKGRSMGIPRIERLQTRPISILHETPHIMVVGRNFCNGFASNQFLLVNKQTKHCIFIDACDDWPDDWVTFISSSKLTLTHIFFTHCHIDNIINLTALMTIVAQHLKTCPGLMWCPAEQVWIDAFPRACQRYRREEEARKVLPFTQNNYYTYNTYAYRLLQRQRSLDQQYQREAAMRNPTDEADPHELGAEAALPLPPELVRRQDILLSCATNRATSFYEFGTHSLLYYIFTPGHSPGHMMLSLPREKLLFTGDVLCYNQIGRVDLPWATGERLAESLLTLEDFPDATVLLPGHGRLTTLGRERRENRALQALYERRELGQQEVSVGFNTGYL
ncbi:unnamed protein product [Phytomonas sp. Hart1]|nr:unnamed protein product [Phytomonas sp. Hart1]|eukprot:CCW68290.1 unnamed protein product [Phytomonas sp. isolate Hart1]